MASRLKRYWYHHKDPQKRDFLQRTENFQSRHMGPHGDYVMKKLQEKLDLMGQVES